MSVAPRYEIIEESDGSFMVEIFDGVLPDTAMRFDSREEAAEWINRERRKHGIDERWE